MLAPSTCALPCGFSLEAVAAQARRLWDHPAWRALPAATRGAVWAVDASAWFRRPGPRVVEGAEALAAILADPLATPAAFRGLGRPLGGADS